MVGTRKTGKTEEKVKKSNLQLECENDFFKKVLLSKTNVMQEKSVRQKKKTKLWHVKGIRVFFRQKMGCSGANFRRTSFFPSSDLFSCQITYTKYAQTEKSDR